MKICHESFSFEEKAEKRKLLIPCEGEKHKVTRNPMGLAYLEPEN